ncbi:MAG: 5-(carboxyamino)imidazole ribonucleotide mutase [Pseudomonadales bacterium]|jgi:5-(carboxyamino)imidazole ribonucleotide mutase|nr:5-(carboxyamino)imidazole ribonucleotide mutase [Pseudomonadales bacterium]MEC8812614.1 5-(carboxyamino)imidazole ribonucleotide mutase [Pseudomonadota bacterium]HAG94732.1 5-(carboxyamino)imidazole ribonucleotide mutase [Gammaproteobacteria bacterium]MBI25254.1 5-(carboxyamino)imidazole ribonucleotide mutase [Pseudomonadales bacterium]HAU14171.1 5-(carboxyamino)imidazole ribonucleotide mutase [Gammaproteobacteria bacterium]|tara:strand:- start:146 stop:655 length:510 start_codon:yes stop_codon:yes gene_type:complete
MSQPFVAIMMGSDSDLPQIEPTLDALAKLKIQYEVKVTSAHHTPELTHSYVKDADKRGCCVFICAGDMVAHLAGAVAAATTKPVVGIPVNAALNGLDSLLSTVQMPGGIPVATVAIGKAGAKNAAYLAAQMMSLADADLAQRLKDERAANAKAVQEKDTALQARLAQKD